MPQRHGAGHGGGQMAVECPRVRDVSGRNGRDGELEQVGPAADGADREAAADDLAEQRQVRRQMFSYSITAMGPPFFPR